MPVGPRLRLQSRNWRAEIAPFAGGRLTRLDWLGGGPPVAVIVPWPDDAAFDPHAWPKAGAFPMLPFSNRLAGGRFTWDGQAVQLDTAPGSSDALHGVAHRMRWEVDSACDSSASLRYRHLPGTGGWPWPFEAALGVALRSEDTEVRLSMRNIGDVAAPAGLGWHPYHPFPHGAAALSFAAGPGHPVGLLGIDTSPETQAAKLLGHRLNAELLRSQTTAFESWQGTFTLRLDKTHWLVAESTGCPHLVLHIPAATGPAPDYVCVEPVTLLPGTLNREQANAGVANIGLVPGGVRTMSWRCRIADRLNGGTSRNQQEET